MCFCLKAGCIFTCTFIVFDDITISADATWMTFIEKFDSPGQTDISYGFDSPSQRISKINNNKLSQDHFLLELHLWVRLPPLLPWFLLSLWLLLHSCVQAKDIWAESKSVEIPVLLWVYHVRYVVMNHQQLFVDTPWTFFNDLVQ